MKELKNTWIELTLKYTSNRSLVEELWQELENNYTYKNRHYHNLNHIKYMVDLASKYKDEIEDYNTILFSIFYHDIIYKSTSSDNELKSAQLATIQLQKIGVDKESIDKCYQQILATKSHIISEDNDTNLLLDFDLAILGDQEELYFNYTKNVRKEYSVYPDLIYKPGRKKVLKHFLKMEKIFKTETFQNSHEKNTRINLNKELQTL